MTETGAQIALNFDSESLRALNVVLALVIYGVSLDLRVSDFVVAFTRPRAFAVGLLAQFVLLPALSFGLILLFKPDPAIALGMLLLAACPGGNISNFLASFGKGNAALSISMSGISTLAAIVMTPLNLTFWASLNPETADLLREFSLDAFALIGTIFWVLLVPLMAGMLTRRYRPGWALRLAPSFRVFSLVVFFGFVGVALWGNRDVIPNFVQLVFFVVLVQNAAAYVVAYGMGRAVQLETPDRRTVMLEVGIQNSALGLVIAFEFFPSLGGMALVLAWWGIWHLVVGLSAAFWWRAQDKRAAP